jgi:hypothetical protein
MTRNSNLLAGFVLAGLLTTDLAAGTKTAAPKGTTADVLFSLSGNEQDFRTGLDVLAKAEVAADVAAAKHRGDKRLIGIFGYALEIPGRETSSTTLPAGYSVTPIKGTSDAITSPTQERFQSRLRKYAALYNKGLLEGAAEQ